MANESQEATGRLFEYCPACTGELDTGYECLKCKRDWRPWAMFEPDSLRDEGYGWCVWRLTDGIWQTDCGDEFVLDDGSPKDNDMDYCCFCGGVIGEARNEPQAEENQRQVKDRHRAALRPQAEEGK